MGNGNHMHRSRVVLKINAAFHPCSRDYSFARRNWRKHSFLSVLIITHSLAKKLKKFTIVNITYMFLGTLLIFPYTTETYSRTVRNCHCRHFSLMKCWFLWFSVWPTCWPPIGSISMFTDWYILDRFNANLCPHQTDEFQEILINSWLKLKK